MWAPIGVPLPFTITGLVDGHAWAWWVGGRAGHPAREGSPRRRMPGVDERAAAAPAYLPAPAIALGRTDRMARKRSV